MIRLNGSTQERLYSLTEPDALPWGLKLKCLRSQSQIRVKCGEYVLLSKFSWTVNLFYFSILIKTHAQRNMCVCLFYCKKNEYNLMTCHLILSPDVENYGGAGVSTHTIWRPLTTSLFLSGWNVGCCGKFSWLFSKRSQTSRFWCKLPSFFILVFKCLKHQVSK